MAKDTNLVVLSGRVIRVAAITGGKIITLGNNQDYKPKDGEWVNVSYYFPLACFWEANVNEGDFITATGKLAMRKDPNDSEGKRSIVAISVEMGGIDNFTTMAQYGNSKDNEKSAPSKPAAAAQKSKPHRKPKADEDEEDDLFG